jgi:hypothetical protein
MNWSALCGVLHIMCRFIHSKALALHQMLLICHP